VDINTIIFNQLLSFINYLEKQITYTKIKIGILVSFFSMVALGTIITDMPIMLIFMIINLLAIKSEFNSLVKLKSSLKKNIIKKNRIIFEMSQKKDLEKSKNYKENTSITKINNKINSIIQYNYEDKPKVLTKNKNK